MFCHERGLLHNNNHTVAIHVIINLEALIECFVIIGQTGDRTNDILHLKGASCQFQQGCVTTLLKMKL
jgi:hypothetical protein